MDNVICLIGWMMFLVPVFISLVYLYYQELRKIKKTSTRIFIISIIFSFVTGATILYAMSI